MIWQPTHTAKYWPAQGFFLAAGQVLMGHPFWGVWLSVGIMCAAVTWMLQAWVGEALVLGALPRMKQAHRARNALLMGLGFAILANSRPYEGLFFGLPVAVALLVWLWKLKQPELGRVLKRAMVPLLAMLALTVLVMGYYFWRTTGNPFNPPYLAYEHQYSPAPVFPWQPLRPMPAYRHAFFREYYSKVWALPQYQQAQSVAGYVGLEVVNSFFFRAFFLGPLFTLPLVLAVVYLPRGFTWKTIGPATRFLLLMLGITLLGEALPTAYAPHYSAPITCVILALVLVAMRRIRRWQPGGKRAGVFISRAVPSISVLLLVLVVGAGIARWPRALAHPEIGILTWCSVAPTNYEREAIRAKLDRQPGKQLVIVQQDGSGKNPFYNWVYNRADLESAKIIWADDMGPAKNQELIDYFKGRRVWLVDADSHPPKLIPYSRGASAQSAAAWQESPRGR